MGHCKVCGERWKGLRVCHCTSCHETFTSSGGFNKHRKGGKCLEPKGLGMVRDEEDRWKTPMPEGLVKRLTGEG